MKLSEIVSCLFSKLSEKIVVHLEFIYSFGKNISSKFSVETKYISVTDLRKKSDINWLYCS